MIKNIAYLILISTVFVACVPKRQLDDMESRYSSEKERSSNFQKKNMVLETENDSMKALMTEMDKRLTALQRDTSVQGKSLRQLTVNYDQLDKTYNELLGLKNKIANNKEIEIRRYMKEIEQTRLDLQEKEDVLNDLKRSLAEKEANLNKLSKDLENSKKTLEEREKRVKELEKIISAKDSAQQALRKKIEDALFGFKDKGLTVHMKDGKIYVSLENELLFKSGSYTVDGKGKDAIKKLAEVLNENPDISIAVEGHTDIDKYNGSGALRDNWDLSVIRATQIVKILEGYKVDPSRLTASGKGEYSPLDPAKTKEAKKKNRRIEIILTPKLDELWNELNK